MLGSTGSFVIMKGSFIAGFNGSCGATDILHAEILALYHGIHSCNWNNLEIPEGDLFFFFK